MACYDYSLVYVKILYGMGWDGMVWNGMTWYGVV